MPVQTQLGGPRRVAAHFEEQRAEISIVDIEVVGIDVDRFVAREQKLPVDLFAWESLRLLLRHAYEYHSIAKTALTSEIVGDIILPFFVVELVERNPLSFRHRLHGLAELLRHLPEHNLRWNRLAQLLPHERHQSTRCRQRPDVAIQVQPVQAFHFQRYMSVQQFRDARHALDSMPGSPLRSWRLGVSP